jgi:hypothetical protein
MCGSSSRMARPRNHKTSPQQNDIHSRPPPSSSTSSFSSSSSSSPSLSLFGSHSNPTSGTSTFSSFLTSFVTSSALSASTNTSSSSSSSSYLEKKDISFEEQTLGGFTLIFQDPNMETKWQSCHLLRQTRLAQRLLFFSGLYQGLFYCSDLIDSQELMNASSSTSSDPSSPSPHLLSAHWTSYFFLFTSMRLFIGVLFVLASFFVSIGLLIPKQSTLCCFQLIYGLPTITIFYLTRSKNTQWDYLFLVYGLCFFALPKISPLNFIYAFYGVAFYTIMFISLSTYQLTFTEWFLSTIYLLMIVLLFLYISYSSEKSARERWLLRERLHREHIDLKIVVSSIEDDMKKAVELRSNYYYGQQQQQQGQQQLQRRHQNSMEGVSDHRKRKYHQHPEESIQLSREMGGTGDNNDRERKRNLSLILFFKGLGAWGLVMLTGYAFDTFNSNPMASLSNSAPFALLLHSTGFSIFLLYFTGQVRWFILNGVVGITMVSILHHSGLNNRWVVISTHSIGYILLAVVCIVMFLVFGGVVLVWSRLIEFLRDIVLRYPQVKDELREEKLLEQVLVRYLSSSSFDKKTFVDEEAGDSTSLFSSSSLTSSPSPSSHSHHDLCPETRNPNERHERDGHGDYKIGESLLAQVITSSSSSSTSFSSSTLHPQCYFCHKPHPPYLLQVCNGWLPHEKSSSSSSNSTPGAGGSGINLCTPYTQVVKSRDDLKDELVMKIEEVKRLQINYDVVVREVIEREKMIEKEREEKRKLLERLEKEEKEWNDRIKREREKRSEDITRIIGEHNKQLSEVKRLYREKSRGMGNLASTKNPEQVKVKDELSSEIIEREKKKEMIGEQPPQQKMTKERLKEKGSTETINTAVKSKKVERTLGERSSSSGGISLYPIKSALPSKPVPPTESSSSAELDQQSLPPQLSGEERGQDEEDVDDLPFDIFLSSMHDIQRMLLDLETEIPSAGAIGTGVESEQDEKHDGVPSGSRMPYALHLFDSSETNPTSCQER